MEKGLQFERVKILILVLSLICDKYRKPSLWSIKGIKRELKKTFPDMLSERNVIYYFLKCK